MRISQVLCITMSIQSLLGAQIYRIGWDFAQGKFGTMMVTLNGPPLFVFLRDTSLKIAMDGMLIMLESQLRDFNALAEQNQDFRKLCWSI